jgi:flagellar hook-length control protein FliK
MPSTPNPTAGVSRVTSTRPATAAIVSALGADAEISTQPAADPAVSAQATMASAGTDGGILSTAGVPMQEMIDSIRATVEIAARQGVARARIELQPQDLGHISIRLTQTAEGLRARVTADTPAGAQALAQGRSELRQSLSSLGVSLLRLDVDSFGQPQAREQGGFTGRSDGSSAHPTKVAPEEEEATAEPAGADRPAGPAMGEIVDVLA